MLDFLKGIDPNVALGWFTLITAAGGYLWAKVRGKKTTDYTEALWQALSGVVLKLAASEDTTDIVRAKLKVALLEAASRMGIPNNALTDTIISKLIERGISEVRKEMIARANGKSLEVALDSTKKVSDAFTPPAKPTVPKLGFTRLCPVPGCVLDMNHSDGHVDASGAQIIVLPDPGAA